jgi:tRNA-2-methylthio-N6-dimethylallyladenosine synthase
MKKIKFINSYSFIFSARPGTPAADMQKVDEIIAKERLLMFQKTADQIKKNYRKQLIDSTVKVLFENKINNENKYFGRDEYFNSVIVQSSFNLIGKIKKIKINNCNQNTLFGEAILDSIQSEFAA